MPSLNIATARLVPGQPERQVEAQARDIGQFLALATPYGSGALYWIGSQQVTGRAVSQLTMAGLPSVVTIAATPPAVIVQPLQFSLG